MSEFKETPQVEFEESAKNVFKKMIRFNGRIRRSEYWWGVLTLFLVSMAIGFIPIIGLVGIFPLALAGCSLTFRRLHDTGRSGWWIGSRIIIECLVFVLLLSLIDWPTFFNALAADDEHAASRALVDGFKNNSGILILCGVLSLVDIALNVIVFIFTLLDSHPETNKYGDSPKYVPTEPTGSVL